MTATTRLVAILTLALISCAGIAGTPDKVRLTNGEWAPFQSQHLPKYGAASHAMTEAFSAVDIQVEYGFFPWNRSMELVKRGLWDGTFMWVLTPEREQTFLASDPLFTVQEVIFYSLDRPLSATRLEQLKGSRMGALDSSAFGAQFGEMIDNGEISVIRARDNEQLFQMLVNGRVDFVPELETSGSDAIREYLSPEQQQQITYMETLTHTWSYHLLVSRATEDGPRYVDAFNQGLAIIKANGTFERIMSPHIRPN